MAGVLFAGLFGGPVATGQVTAAGSQYSVWADGPNGSLSSPGSVAVDGNGNLYIADAGNNRIVRVVPSASGSSEQTIVFSGLSAPGGVAVDWSGNLFVADTGNNRILILPAAQLSLGQSIQPVTVAAGFNGPTGVAVDASENLYVADTGNNRVVMLPSVGGGYGVPVPIGSGFQTPAGIAVDSNRNVYVADSGNNRIVKEPFGASGYETQQILLRNLISPMGVAVDKSFDLYIADSGNNRVVEEPWAAGAGRYNSQVVIGSGFQSPQAVAVDANGNAYVADSRTDRIVEVIPGTLSFGEIAANSSSGTLTYNFQIAAGTTVGTVTVMTQGVAGKDYQDAGASSCAAQTYLTTVVCSVNVAFTPLGSGTRMGAVSLYDSVGNVLATIYLSGIGLEPQSGFIPGATTLIGTQLTAPAGVAVDGSGNLFIADTGNNRIVEVAWTAGGYGAQITLPITGLNTPMGLAIDGAGNLYIASSGNDKVIKLLWNGTGFGAQTKIAVGVYGPSAIAVDGSGALYIADTLDNDIYKLAWNGTEYSSTRTLGNYRKNPIGVAPDGQGNVYFTMPYLNDLAVVPWSGSQYGVQENIPVEGESFPTALAVDGNSNLYLLDTGNNRVVMLPWTGDGFGKQTTVAGGLNTPGGMTVDANGNLYVADTGNNQVVKIDFSSPQALSFAQTYLGSTSTDSAKVSLIENIGNQPLTLTNLTYPADFPEDAGAENPCSAGTALSPGNSCEVSVDFTPLTVGSPLNEAITVADNALSNVALLQSIPVSGVSEGKLSQMIGFPPIPNVIYGASPLALSATASSGLPVTYQVIAGSASLNQVGNSLSVTGAGVITVVASQAGNLSYASAVAVTQSFVVAQATLTVTPVSVAAVYGSVANPDNYTVSGFVAGQSGSRAFTGQPAISSNATSHSGAGSYTLTASRGTLASPNYNFVFATGVLTIDKAPLQVRAMPVSIGYGNALPQLPWTLVGFVDGDTASVVVGAPLLTSTSSAGAGAGKYAIMPSVGTLAAANYSFTFAAATLIVVPAVLTVEAASFSMTYGGPLPQLTYTISGFAPGDNASTAVQGLPAIATGATSHSACGVYTVAPTVGTLVANNYKFAFVAGSLTVQKAPLTVIPLDRGMTYGAQVPSFPYTVSGLVNGDTLYSAMTGKPALSTSATPKSQPGTYTIDAAIGTLASNNYTLNAVAGALTIQKAVLTVIPHPVAIPYGQPLPAVTFDLRGFVNGDGPNSVSGAPILVTGASPVMPVGNYQITVAVGTLTSTCYEFEMTNAAIRIDKAVLTLTARNAWMSYGGAIPTFAYTLTGFANGDAANVVTGRPTFISGASSRSSVGVYPLQIASGTLVADNYSFEPIAGQISVQPAVLTVMGKIQSMTYGSPLPKLGYEYVGLINGDAPSVVNGLPVVSTTAQSGSPAGRYPIHVSVGTLSAKNYNFKFVAGSLTVNRAIASVIAASQNITYGGVVPTMTYVVKGLVNGDTLSNAVTGKAQLTTLASASSPVGKYAIETAAGSLSSDNYSFVYLPGTLFVNKAPLTVAANDLTMQLGATLPTLTYTMSGFVNGDTQASATAGSPVLSTTAATSSTSGRYGIAVTAGTLTSSNYSLTFKNGVLTVTQ